MNDDTDERCCQIQRLEFPLNSSSTFAVAMDETIKQSCQAISLRPKLARQLLCYDQQFPGFKLATIHSRTSDVRWFFSCISV